MIVYGFNMLIHHFDGFFQNLLPLSIDANDSFTNLLREASSMPSRNPIAVFLLYLLCIFRFQRLYSFMLEVEIMPFLFAPFRFLR